jgi:hypothetical protein
MSTASLLSRTGPFVAARSTCTRSSIFPRHQLLAAGRTTNTSSRSRRRFESSSSSSSKTKKDNPPLPSPAKAKQQYLESKKKLDPNDVVGKMQQLSEELNIVRERNVKLLDKELNKSIWRKLTDPLRRYKHSVINMGAVTLAYILAHNLFMAKKQQRQVQGDLEESQQDVSRLQGLLRSLLLDNTHDEIASHCAQQVVAVTEELQESSSLSSPRQQSSTGWFWSSSSKRRFAWNTNTQDKQQETLENTLKTMIRNEMESRIGDAALTQDERKQKGMEQVRQENKSQLEEWSENPELLLQAMFEDEATNNEGEQRVVTTTEDEDGRQVVKKQVFSM